MSNNLDFPNEPIYEDPARLTVKFNDNEPGYTVNESPDELPTSPLSQSSDDLLNAPFQSGQNIPSELTEGMEHPKKQKVNSFQKRLNQQVYKTKLAEEEKAQLSFRLQEAERRIAQQDQELRKKSEMVNSYYDAAADTQELVIKNALKDAKLTGDVDLETDLTERLSALKAERATNRLYEIQKQERERVDYNNMSYDPSETIEVPAYIPSSEPEYYEDESNPVHDWFSENPWIQRNPKLSSDFNELLENYQAQLDLSGIDVNPIDLLNQVKSDLMEHYQIPNRGNGQQQQRQAPPQNPKSYGRGNVAPVSRGGSMAEQYISSSHNKENVYHFNADQLAALDHFVARDPSKTRAQHAEDLYQSIRKFQRIQPGGKLGFTAGE